MTVLQIIIVSLVVTFVLFLLVICAYGIIDANEFSAQMKEWNKRNEEFKKEYDRI